MQDDGCNKVGANCSGSRNDEEKACSNSSSSCRKVEKQMQSEGGDAKAENAEPELAKLAELVEDGKGKTKNEDKVEAVPPNQD